ncbi:MAG TPA: hypothetical protein VN675_09165 [Burkholderiales bacterium]|nr:hypothetical protein [Burkholderiales bacterium]
MKTLAPFLAVPLFATLLGGCYNPKYPSETPGTERIERQSANTVHNTYRTGWGTVLAVTHPSTAAAGATNMQNTEVTLRMDDGTQQTIMLPGSTEFHAGDRVEVTNDPYVLRR